MLSILTSGYEARLVFLMAIAYVIAILGAIILHELAHGLVAYWNGDLTAKMRGRLSLNPLKHLDPIGSLMLLVVGFGWAKPVPIDSRQFRHFRKGMITTALAGVATNLILALISFGGFAIVNAVAGPQTLTQGAYYAVRFFQYLFLYGATINLTLMAFNLIPIYPLDGFRIVETLAKPNNRYVEFNYRYGNFLLLGLLVASTLLGYITPYLNIFSLYINGVIRLFGMIFHVGF